MTAYLLCLKGSDTYLTVLGSQALNENVFIDMLSYALYAHPLLNQDIWRLQKPSKHQARYN